MMHAPRQICHPHSERGTALIAVLLLLMLMSAIAAALGVSGQTETLVARNHQTAAQARAAAEAGINRAAQVMVAWLALWPNTYPDVDTAINALLADPTLLDTAKIDFAGPPYTLATGIEYEVDLLDDDNPNRSGGAQLLQDDDDDANNEDGDPTTDGNRILILRAIGRAQNAQVELEAVLGPLKLPAIVSAGDLDVGDSVAIAAGGNGGIHANGRLAFTGMNAINDTATASGSYEGSTTIPTGAFGAGFPLKDVPDVRASFYRSWADYVLEASGLITCNRPGGCTRGATMYPYSTAVCDATPVGDPCQSDYGWRFDYATPSWQLMATDATNPPYGEATFYVETLAELQQAGSVADPLNLTVVAEGSIDVTGNVVLTPDSTELLFVTDGDFQISGTGNVNMPSPAASEGQILVHEQVNINSTDAVLLGQLVIEDAEEQDMLVTRSTDAIQGVTVTYTGGVGNALFHISGWREVR